MGKRQDSPIWLVISSRPAVGCHVRLTLYELAFANEECGSGNSFARCWREFGIIGDFRYAADELDTVAKDNPEPAA